MSGVEYGDVLVECGDVVVGFVVGVEVVVYLGVVLCVIVDDDVFFLLV